MHATNGIEVILQVRDFRQNAMNRKQQIGILLPVRMVVFQVEFNKAAQSFSDAYTPSASRKAALSRLLKVLTLRPVQKGSGEVDFQLNFIRCEVFNLVQRLGISKSYTTTDPVILLFFLTIT